MGIKEEQKQHLIDLMNRETLEEAALKWFMTANKHEIIFDLGWIKIFEAGAKWQAQRLYSEEEVLKLLLQFYKDKPIIVFDATQWFEQFKKQ